MRENDLFKRFFLGSLLAFYLFNPDAQAEKVDKIKIGATLPLSGPLAFVGHGVQEGINIALSEGLDQKFEVLFDDDRTLDRSATVSATRKFIDVDGVLVVLNSMMHSVTAVAPIVNRAGVPTLVIWDSNKKLLELGEYIYGFGYANEAAGEDMAKFAIDSLKLKTVALINMHDEWSEILVNEFSKVFTAGAGKVLFREAVALETTEFRPLILRAKKLGVDAFYAPLCAQALTSFVKQARELGYKGHLFTADCMSEMEAKDLGSASDGMYLTQIWLENDTLAAAYNKKYGKDSPKGNMGFVALGYDVMSCLETVRKNLSDNGLEPSRKAFHSELSQVSCGGLGGTIDYSRGRISTKREPVLQVKSGRFQSLG